MAVEDIYWVTLESSHLDASNVSLIKIKDDVRSKWLAEFEYLLKYQPETMCHCISHSLSQLPYISPHKNRNSLTLLGKYLHLFTGLRVGRLPNNKVYVWIYISVTNKSNIFGKRTEGKWWLQFHFKTMIEIWCFYFFNACLYLQVLHSYKYEAETNCRDRVLNLKRISSKWHTEKIKKLSLSA